MRYAEARSARRQVVDVPASSVYYVNFMDTSPNSCYVRNNGASPIYIGFHSTPSPSDCDLCVKGGMVKTYGEQHAFGRMMIFNEAATPTRVVIMSWEAGEFDPTLLQGDFDFAADLQNALKYDGIIRGFNSALPMGTQHIGSVDVDNQVWSADRIAEVVSLLTSIKNKETSVDIPESVWTTDSITALSALISGVSEAVAKVETAVGKVETAVEGIEVSGGSQTPVTVNYYSKLYEVSGGSAPVSYGGDYPGGKLNFITNDGDTDIDLSILDHEDLNWTSCTLKAGETMTDLRYGSRIEVNPKTSGEAISYRLAIEVS